jgi:hypothetical protein
MSSGPAKRRIRLIAPILLMAVVALLAGVASTGATFNPDADIEIGNHDGDDTAGTNASITSVYHIPANNQNFDSIVTYTPPDFFVAEGEDIPIGDTVGILTSRATLGLTFTPCSIRLDVEIVTCESDSSICDVSPVGVTNGMLNASIDRSDTFESAGNIGLGPLTADPNKWNGFDVMPSGNYRMVDEYPDFLEASPLSYPQPRARYAGLAFLPAFPTWVVVQFLVFDPGTNIGQGIPSDPEWGYGSLTVVNNPTIVDFAASSGDFCTNASEPGFLSNATIFGESEGGDTLRTNPSCGDEYLFHNWSRGRADDDGDSFENYIDTCPYGVDGASEDPRNPTFGAPDGDFINASCDPDPAASCYPGAPGLGTNCDNDLFETLADNCPMVANNDQGTAAGDTDLDQIGNLCDDGNTVTRPTKAVEIPVEIEGPACGEETPTPTPTPTVVGSATATPTPSGTETATVTATPQPGMEGICGISFPGTYNGFARLNGVPANGYVVTAEVGGEDWGSAVVQNGRYALDVPDHPPATPPCFPPEAGVDLVFKIDGATCTTTPEATSWSAGLHDVDLACAPAATATPSTPPPGTQPPAGTPAPGTPGATATPARPPSTGGGGFGGDGDLPVWAIVLAGWAGLTALAGLGTLATRIAKR